MLLVAWDGGVLVAGTIEPSQRPKICVTVRSLGIENLRQARMALI
jgi:hypothetical protein